MESTAHYGGYNNLAKIRLGKPIENNYYKRKLLTTPPDCITCCKSKCNIMICKSESTQVNRDDN